MQRNHCKIKRFWGDMDPDTLSGRTLSHSVQQQLIQIQLWKSKFNTDHKLIMDETSPELNPKRIHAVK